MTLMDLQTYITLCQAIKVVVVCLNLVTEKFEEYILMNEASMSAESNDDFMDMANFSD